MGSFGGGDTSIVEAQAVPTPAVARTVDADIESAQAEQERLRQRRKGISSTYTRFNGSAGSTADNGSAKTLG